MPGETVCATSAWAGVMRASSACTGAASSRCGQRKLVKLTWSIVVLACRRMLETLMAKTTQEQMQADGPRASRLCRPSWKPGRRASPFVSSAVAVGAYVRANGLPLKLASGALARPRLGVFEEIPDEAGPQWAFRGGGRSLGNQRSNHDSPRQNAFPQVRPCRSSAAN